MTQAQLEAQLEAPAERSGSVGLGLRRVITGGLDRFIKWMPVWAPLVLLAQIGHLGLRPALGERQRLEQREAEVVDRWQAAAAERSALEAERAALGDPMYIERLKQLRESR